jgi:hypothetical protein
VGGMGTQMILKWALEQNNLKLKQKYPGPLSHTLVPIVREEEEI